MTLSLSEGHYISAGDRPSSSPSSVGTSSQYLATSRFSVQYSAHKLPSSYIHVRQVDHVPKVGLVSELTGKFPKHDEGSTLFTLAGIRVLGVLQETTVNAPQCMDCIIESGKCTTIGSPVNRITSISLHSLAGPAVCSAENERLHRFEFEQATAAAAGA